MRLAMSKLRSYEKPAMKTLSIKVPAELEEKVERMARRRRTSRSAIVREALEAYEHPEGSFGALAEDLCGSLEGPPDLSTNPDHLAGYGG